MHEMSIAEGIVDIVLDTMKNNDASQVHSVQLDVGMMSGVEPDALHFCWESGTQGTAAQGAKLDINLVPIVGRCFDCGTMFDVKEYVFVCPKCGSRIVQTASGKELRVTSIDID